MEQNKEHTQLIIDFLSLEVIHEYPYSKTYKLWGKILPYIGIEEYGDDTTLKYTDECNDYEMKFHTSWDWLMYVIDKIIELGSNVEFDDNDVSITHGGEYSCGSGDLMGGTADVEIWKHEKSKFENAYDAVIEYIISFNNKDEKWNY